jgi:hypothetical protein
MTEATELAEQAGSPDPVVGLRAVWALSLLLDQLERLQVDNARNQGWTWQQIADELHVTRQAVHQKHARRRLVEDKE